MMMDAEATSCMILKSQKQEIQPSFFPSILILIFINELETNSRKHLVGKSTFPF